MARLDNVNSKSDSSSKTRLSNTESHNQRIRERVQSISSNRERAGSLTWVDKDYIKQNPWYGKPSDKPLWSLARPFPHVVRWGRQPDGSTNLVPVSADELAELGQANLSNIPEPVLEKQGSSGECTSCKLRRATAEAAHSDRRNDSEPLGQREHDEVEQGGKDPEETRNWWARKRAKHPEPLAEFLATLVAVFMGLAANLSVNLSANQATQYGTYETSCWAWGLAWMFGIYLGGGASGAHMNPAISVCLHLFRGFPLRLCLMAFFSSPQPWVPVDTAILNQMVGGAIMMIAVFAVGDDHNNPPEAGMHGLVLGLLLTALKFTLGFNVGSALNPASDFGPRIVLWSFGYRGPEIFGTIWWWCGPGLATIAGSTLGGIAMINLIISVAHQ
ncbi:hypothetical protein ABKA04_008066 [Annulohypoxylon sp. FPYF3050]